MFARKFTLQLHAATHSGIKPFHCERCDKYFSTEWHLKKHVRIHNGKIKKNHHCEHCDRYFVSGADLKDHKNSHTGNRPYECKACGKSFSRRDAFYTHKQSHNTIECFECQECGKSFTTKRKLTVHGYKHRTDKPFKCTVCGNCYTHNYILTKHIKQSQATSHSGMEMEVSIHNTKTNILKENQIGDGQSYYQMKFLFEIRVGNNVIGSCDIYIDNSKGPIAFLDKTGNTFMFMPNTKKINFCAESKESDENNNRMPLEEVTSNELTTTDHKVILQSHEERYQVNTNVNDLEPCINKFLTNESDLSTNELEGCHDEVGENVNHSKVNEFTNEEIDEGSDEFVEQYESNPISNDPEILSGNNDELSNDKSKCSKPSVDLFFDITRHDNTNETSDHQNYEVGVKIEKLVPGSHALPIVNDSPLSSLSIENSKKTLEKANENNLVENQTNKFQCQECGKFYSTEKTLKIHINTIHEENGHFNCEECGKTFATLIYLKRHEKIHGVKLHICEECGKSFTQRCILLKHQKTHTGVKPFECKECGKRFAYKASVFGHIKAVHKGLRPFECPECGKSFSHKSSMIHHCLTANMVNTFDNNHLNGSEDEESSDLYFDITRGGGLNDSDNESDSKNSEEIERPNKKQSIKIELEQDDPNLDFQHELNFNLRNDFKVEDEGLSGVKHQILNSNDLGEGVNKNESIGGSSSLADDLLDRKYSTECGKAFSQDDPGSFRSSYNEVINEHGWNIDNKTKEFSEKQKPMKLYNGSKPKVQCDDCGKLLHKGSLKRHEAIHRGIKEFECNECGKCFFQKVNMLKHQRFVHRGIKPYECKECGKEFSRTADRRKHENNVHKVLEVQVLRSDEINKTMDKSCSDSEKSSEIIENEDILVATGYIKIEEEHIIGNTCCENGSHGDPHEIKLEIDDFADDESTFYNENEIMGECFEIKIEEDDNDNVPVNGKDDFTNIRDKAAFTNGISRETANKNSLMEVANFIVQEETDRRYNVSKVKKSRSFECTECGKCYKARRSLKIHQRIHTIQSDNFQCKECGKSFAQFDELQLHEIVHKDTTNKFECEECGKSFTRKGNLKQHLGTHTDHRPFYCTVCGKAFKHRCNLVEHSRIHIGFKPFRCKECGKSYRTATHLKSHSRTHSN
ncbi:zinc finger protein 493-like [Clytia hemisphaerica]|uniref:zinc finger protein 493-like n=1 Tax=Clytia hemisphaerica TaxID=252671 RepID=UPI0034D4D8D1